jgi:hypothetical protein
MKEDDGMYLLDRLYFKKNQEQEELSKLFMVRKDLSTDIVLLLEQIDNIFGNETLVYVRKFDESEYINDHRLWVWIQGNPLCVITQEKLARIDEWFMSIWNLRIQYKLSNIIFEKVEIEENIL